MNIKQFEKNIKSNYLFESLDIVIESDFVPFLFETFKVNEISNEKFDIHELLQKTNIFEFHVFSFSFLKEIIETNQMVIFAEQDADPILIDKRNNEVILINHDSIDIYDIDNEEYIDSINNTNNLKCSKSIESYVTCLLITYKFCEYCDYLGSIDTNIEQEVLKKCIQVAGGVEYKSYWEYFYYTDLIA